VAHAQLADTLPLRKYNHGSKNVDLQYGQEQSILRDTAEKFLAANYDYNKFRQIAGSEPGYSEANWTQFASE